MLDKNFEISPNKTKTIKSKDYHSRNIFNQNYQDNTNINSYDYLIELIMSAK